VAHIASFIFRVVAFKACGAENIRFVAFPGAVAGNHACVVAVRAGFAKFGRTARIFFSGRLGIIYAVFTACR